jgi:hypothetical protein
MRIRQGNSQHLLAYPAHGNGSRVPEVIPGLINPPLLSLTECIGPFLDHLREIEMNRVGKTVSVAKCGLTLCLVLVGVACSKSLNSLEGPETGLVSGFVCKDMPVLSAAVEVPAMQSTFISEGKCVNLRSSVSVKFVRTVMMPGDGKYSQFEYAADGKNLKLWISTAKVRKA